MADFDAQGADGVVDDAGFVCAEEDEVAVLRVHPFDDVERNRAFCAAFGGEEFDDGRLQAFNVGCVVDFDVGEAFLCG